MAQHYKRAFSILALALALALTAQPAWSGALKVAPIRVTLDTQNNIQVMRIENSGGQSTRVQLRLFNWSQKDGQENLVPTRDILANPTMFEIAPGKVQIVRIGGRVPVGLVEQSYRLLVDEVPDSAEPKAGEIRSLLRISIPVFVTAAKASPHLSWHARPDGPATLALTLDNTGNTHVQIRGISIQSRRDGTELGTSRQMLYLLPGTQRHITIPYTGQIKAGQLLKMRIATGDRDIVADLPVEGTVDAENRN